MRLDARRFSWDRRGNRQRQQNDKTTRDHSLVKRCFSSFDVLKFNVASNRRRLHSTSDLYSTLHASLKEIIIIADSQCVSAIFEGIARRLKEARVKHGGRRVHGKKHQERTPIFNFLPAFFLSFSTF